MDLELTDRTCLKTVHSDGLISEDLDRRTSIACTPACNHPTRNNESTDLLVPSRARLHTSYDSQFASMYRSIYAVTIRPKSLYEDVHASTGHPGYTGMQWPRSVPTTRTKMQLLLELFVKDALSVVHINTRPTSTMLCPTHLMTQVSNSSLTHLHITALVTAAMYMLLCPLTSPQDKSIPCSRSPS